MAQLGSFGSLRKFLRTELPGLRSILCTCAYCEDLMRDISTLRQTLLAPRPFAASLIGHAALITGLVVYGLGNHGSAVSVAAVAIRLSPPEAERPDDTPVTPIQYEEVTPDEVQVVEDYPLPEAIQEPEQTPLPTVMKPELPVLKQPFPERLDTDQPAQPLIEAVNGENAPPEYPLIARKMGWEGDVRLAITVNSAGAVDKVEVLKSAGRQELDFAAVNAAWKWRFKVAQYVEQVTVQIVIRFHLKDRHAGEPQ
jgi:TonB family protein